MGSHKTGSFDYAAWQNALLKRLAIDEQAFHNPGQLQDIEHDDEGHKRARLVLALDQISALMEAVLKLPGLHDAPLEAARQLVGELSDLSQGKRAEMLDLAITNPRADPMTLAPTKAFASFAVNALIQRGQSANQAQKAAAEIMSSAGFLNRSGKKIGTGTVRKWCDAAQSDDNVKYVDRGLWNEASKHFREKWPNGVSDEDFADWLGKVARLLNSRPGI